jgi:hypothetical protein
MNQVQKQIESLKKKLDKIHKKIINDNELFFTDIGVQFILLQKEFQVLGKLLKRDGIKITLPKSIKKIPLEL